MVNVGGVSKVYKNNKKVIDSQKNFCLTMTNYYGNYFQDNVYVLPLVSSVSNDDVFNIFNKIALGQGLIVTRISMTEMDAEKGSKSKEFLTSNISQWLHCKLNINESPNQKFITIQFTKRGLLASGKFGEWKRKAFFYSFYALLHDAFVEANFVPENVINDYKIMGQKLDVFDQVSLGEGYKTSSELANFQINNKESSTTSNLKMAFYIIVIIFSLLVIILLSG
ncbi:MAG: hypothetical protein ACFFD1_07630 [Candidatus Thorarchaeota archaeon]